MEEWIIPLVFVVLAVVRPLFNGLKAAWKKADESRRPKRSAPGWLQRTMERLREAVEAAAEQAEGRRTSDEPFDWGGLFGTGEASDTETEGAPEWDLEPAETVSPEARTEPYRPPPESAAPPPRGAPEIEPPARPGEPGRAISPRAPPRSARDLRQAVVWSEILAPPVALRREEADRVGD